MELNGLNISFPILREDGTPFHDLVLRKATYESVVMSLSDKITGDVYYPTNDLVCTMREYIVYDDVKFGLVSPPTIVREGMVADNSEAYGMTKYSFEFYHPMAQLANLPFTDVAVSYNEQRFKSQDKTFSWIGYLQDMVDKLNKNLQATQWVVVISENVEQERLEKLSEVLSFDNQMIADVLKTTYETYDVSYVVGKVGQGEYFDIGGNDYYDLGKRFVITFGDPTNDIYANDAARQQNLPYMFQFGKGVGLKNNSADPRNNKIVTRLMGYGSEDNVPYGYPQIRWTGNQEWDYTLENNSDNPNSYPIYKGILGGEWVKLIKHPFTRTHLMPPIYVDTLKRKVDPNNANYDPTIEIVDYYDADLTYPNPINPESPSVEIHQFENIKPELDVNREIGIVGVSEVTNDEVNQTMNINGESEMDIHTMSQAQFKQEIDTLEYGVLPDAVDRHEIIEMLDEIVVYAHSDSKASLKTTHGFYATLEPHYGYLLVQVYIPMVTRTFYVEPNTPKYKSSTNYTSYNVLNTTTQGTLSAGGVVWDDSMDDNGNYNQSYFKITIPQLPFDLYACAAIPQEMQIFMRSGACIGCTFQVMVDWDDYKKNFYDEDGNFVPDGAGRNLDKYPKSQDGAITLIVQKDTETFGTIMPNIYQEPLAGDVFVILGISLPLSYVTAAESRLETAMLDYMRANNVHYFDYPLKFDEYFLATNRYILNQIKPNSRVVFDFAGSEVTLFVKELSVKYGEAALPTYDITLTDKIEVVLNQIGQVVEDVNALSNMLNSGNSGGGFGNFTTNPINQKLSRVNNDTAEGKITFLQGLDIASRGGIDADGNATFQTVGSQSFTQGYLDGTGWRIWLEGELSKLEVDSLTVRKVMNVAEMLIHRVRATGGEIIVSNADGKIRSVSQSQGNWVVMLENPENENMFVVGDYARCQVVQNGIIRQYWRKVLAVDGMTLTLDNSAGDEPQIGDTLVQMGSDVESRQGAIRISASEGELPLIDVLDMISSASFSQANIKARLGGLDGISDRRLKKQPQGYGLYSNNVYLRGEFVLSNGTDIGSQFEVLEDRFLSRITDSSYGDNIVKNPYFDDIENGQIVNWTTSFTATTTLNIVRAGDFPIALDDMLVGNAPSASESCITYRNGIKVLHIAQNDYLSQAITDNGLINYLRIRAYARTSSTLDIDWGYSGLIHQFDGGWETISCPVETNADFTLTLTAYGGWVEIESVILAPTVTSEIEQTADRITLQVADDLNRTGIDIEAGKITLDAENTIVTGTLEVNKLKTIPSDGGAFIRAAGSIMEVFGSAGIMNIQFGVNEDGYAVLKYYDNLGNFLYDLGPDGLTRSGVQEEQRISHSMNTKHDLTGTDVTLYEYRAKKNAGVIVAGTIITSAQEAAQKNMRWFTDYSLSTAANGNTTYFEYGSQIQELASLANWNGDHDAALFDMDIPGQQSDGHPWDWTYKQGSVDPYELNKHIKWRAYATFNQGEPYYVYYYWQ